MDFKTLTDIKKKIIKLIIATIVLNLLEVRNFSCSYKDLALTCSEEIHNSSGFPNKFDYDILINGINRLTNKLFSFGIAYTHRKHARGNLPCESLVQF